MRRRNLLICCITAICLPLVSCENEKKPNVDIDFSNYTIEPGKGLGPLLFSIDRSEIIKHFGKPERGSEYAFEYPSLGLGVVLTVEGKLNTLYFGCEMCAPDDDLVINCKFRTPEGVGLLSTMEEVRSVYGEPDEEGSSIFRYRSKIAFKFRNNRVVHMTLRE
jgi:hypothetical protein